MDGLAGNMQAQPRVFAHDASIVYTDKRLIWLEPESLIGGSGYAAGTFTVTGADSGANNATVTITVSDGAVATAVIAVVGSGYTDGEVLTIGGAGTGGSIVGHTSFVGSENRGVCLYVGGAGDVEVVMEGATSDTDLVEFAGVAAGTFLPILVKRVNSANTSATLLLALY